MTMQAPSEFADLTVVGAGLAGSEAAWQAAQRGLRVALCEMRPRRTTPAHVTDRFAELVCSNSLGSELLDRPSGLLQEELRRMGSLILGAAARAQVPAGSALAVDRDVFAAHVTQLVESHPMIDIRRQEIPAVPPEGPTIIATGPLTSDALAADIRRQTGEDYLYFYDAMAPIVELDSIDMGACFRGSRYGRGRRDDGDYINCPMDENRYRQFVAALTAAETMALRNFEREDPKFFDRCLPIEILAARGEDTLAFGPMRPVGLTDPHTGRQPFAVVQLRQDNLADTLYNMVGFQTNIKWGEQERVLRMIPGLENADFVRMGQMHRNTFLKSPALLEPTMQFRSRPELFFAGQITGVEGYVGNAGTGFVAGLNAARLACGRPELTLPRDTMIGALCWYVTHADANSFQPMKANFGIVPPLPNRIRNKRDRNRAYAERALASLESVLPEIEPAPTEEIADAKK